MPSELSTLSDKQVAERMVDFIQRAEALRKQIDAYLYDPRASIDQQAVLDEYACLRDEIREDAQWLRLEQNSWFKKENNLRNAYHCRIYETAASGYKQPIRSGVNFKIYEAAEIGVYNLTKPYLLEEWIELAK